MSIMCVFMGASVCSRKTGACVGVSGHSSNVNLVHGHRIYFHTQSAADYEHYSGTQGDES